MTEEKAVESLVSQAMRMVREMIHCRSKPMLMQQPQVDKEALTSKSLACPPL